MKLTRREVVDINHILATTNYDMPIHSRFRYMVTKNISVTKKEIDEINTAFPSPEGAKEYQQKVTDIYVKYNVNTDEDYKNLPEETKKSFDEESKKLTEENKELIEEIKALNKEKDEFLSEEIELPITTVKLDYVPTISQKNQYNGWDIWRTLEKVIDDE